MLCLCGLMLGASAPVSAQDFEGVEIETIPLGAGLFMLTGRGGNMGLSVGEDGAFLIDDQFAPLTKKIEAAVAALSPAPIRFVFNTHWHGDHTGGNKNFNALGATIVAHDNVRAEMIGRWFKDANGGFIDSNALPKITFNDRISFHLNGETVEIIKVPAAHTDGDAIVHFAGSDVLHMGDVFFNGLYSYFDGSSGGRIDGMIDALGIGLRIAGPQTKIVPGHGGLANRDALKRHRDRLMIIRDRTAEALAKGISLDDFLASKPTRDLEDAFGSGYKVMSAEKFLSLVYTDLKKAE